MDLSKTLAVEALDYGIQFATDHETEFVADIDALIKTGEHNAASATVAIFKSKIPLVGGSIGGAFAAELDTLEPQAENLVKLGYDKGLAFLKDLRAKVAA